MLHVSLTPSQIRLFGLMSILSDPSHPIHHRPLDPASLPVTRANITPIIDRAVNVVTPFPPELIDLIVDYLFDFCFFTGSSHGEIVQWDLKTLKPLQTMQTHNGHPISGLVASFDPKHIISGGQDGVIQVHSLGRSGDWVATRVLLPTKPTSAPVPVWSMEAGYIRNAQCSPPNPDSASLSPDSHSTLNQPEFLPVLAAGLHNNSVLVFNILSGYCLYSLQAHTSKVSALAFLSHTHLVSGSWDTRIRIWNLPLQYSEFVCLGHSTNVNAIAIINSKLNIFVSADQNGKLLVWKVPNRVQNGESAGKSAAADSSFSSGSVDSSTRIPSEFSFPAEVFFQSPPIEPPSDEAPRPCEELQPIHRVDAHSAAINCLTFIPDAESSAGESPDSLGLSGYLFTGSRDQSIRGWKVEVRPSTGSGDEIQVCEQPPLFLTIQRVCELHTPNHSVLSLRSLPGSLLASGCSGGQVFVWDLSSISWSPDRIAPQTHFAAHKHGVRTIELQEYMIDDPALVVADSDYAQQQQSEKGNKIQVAV